MADEFVVRIGEQHASKDAGAVLVALGLGSCVGLALVDSERRVAGLAHIMLPESRPGVEGDLRFADHAVPELVRRVLALGARTPRLSAILVGGADMFIGRAGSQAIGARNEAATREALRAAGLRVAKASTRGNSGRTMRVEVATGSVSFRIAGGALQALTPKARV